jgi:hypothetical protein
MAPATAADHARELEPRISDPAGWLGTGPLGALSQGALELQDPRGVLSVNIDGAGPRGSEPA